MSSLTYFAGRPDFDWEFLLRDVLANGTLANNTGTTIDLEWIDSGHTITLSLTGSGITNSNADTLTGGNFTGFSLAFDDGGSTTVLTMSALTLLSFSDMQTILDGPTGSTDPTSDGFHTLIGPMFTDEQL